MLHFFRCRSGFGITEILVSVTILAITGAGVLSVYRGFYDSYQYSQDQWYARKYLAYIHALVQQTSVEIPYSSVFLNFTDENTFSFSADSSFSTGSLYFFVPSGTRASFSHTIEYSGSGGSLFGSGQQVYHIAVSFNEITGSGFVVR